MNKLRVLILTGVVALITNIPKTAYATTLLSQVPPIFVPTQPGVKVCWQTTHMTNNDQVLQSACSTPGVTSTPQPTPQPTLTPTTNPTPLPLQAPVEIKIKKEEVPVSKYQSENNEQSNNQSSDKPITNERSETKVIGELIVPALGVLNDLLD